MEYTPLPYDDASFGTDPIVEERLSAIDSELHAPYRRLVVIAEITRRGAEMHPDQEVWQQNNSRAQQNLRDFQDAFDIFSTP